MRIRALPSGIESTRPTRSNDILLPPNLRTARELLRLSREAAEEARRVARRQESESMSRTPDAPTVIEAGGRTTRTWSV